MEAVGMLSALGDGSEVLNRRWRSPVPEVEDEGKGGVVGRPASRGSVWGSRMKRRSFWARRRGVGWPVAMATASGGCGCARVSARERGRGGERVQRVRERRQGLRGVVVARLEGSGSCG